MPSFAYTARDGAGALTSGTVDGASQVDAARRLRDDGLTVTDIRLATNIVDTERMRTQAAARRVKRDEVIGFTDQLAVMLETGVPLAEALEAFLKQTKPGSFRRVVEIVADRITSGLSFSVAISEFPQVFPRLMVSLLEASEAAGALDRMLRRVSDYLGKERATRKQVKGALTYPIVMVTMAIMVTSFLVVWVLPKFAAIYESREATLPAPTRMLIGLSDAISERGVVVGLSVFGAIALGYVVSRSERGRQCIDRAKIRMPIIGPIFTNFYLTRASRTFATLLAAGVTLPECIRILRGVVDNCVWRKLWNDIDISIAEGKTLSEAVLASEAMPASVAQMIAAGERAGRLPDVLERIADVTERDFDESIRTGTQMLEPLMITVMGTLIGGVAIALLLPIFTMGSTMGN